MAQPFTATYRMVMNYHVTGVPHKTRFYVISDGSSSGGVPNITKRDGTFATWRAVLDEYVLGSLNYIFDDTQVTFGNSVFEHLVGGLWLPVDTSPVTGFTNAIGAPVLASQQTLVLRDMTFDFIKVVLLETSAPAPYHSSSPPSSGIAQSLSAVFLSSYAALAMYNFVVSRSNDYIKTVGAFVGQTGTFNRKLRRRRGFA